jgi:catechol 2,3-dioxygenase-like lactoylglutathione lyase family enzyme
MHVDHIDHVVLTVRDIEATCAFYARVLGMEVVTFGDGRKALRFGRQKLNLHAAGKEIEPKARVPTVGAVDLCFITDVPLEDVVRHLHACGVAIELGPVQRSGATGPIISLYIRDPDWNLIELANAA